MHNSSPPTSIHLVDLLRSFRIPKRKFSVLWTAVLASLQWLLYPNETSIQFFFQRAKKNENHLVPSQVPAHYMVGGPTTQKLLNALGHFGLTIRGWSLSWSKITALESFPRLLDLIFGFSFHNFINFDFLIMNNFLAQLSRLTLIFKVEGLHEHSWSQI